MRLLPFLLALPLLAQPPKLEFEVASVKLVPGNGLPAGYTIAPRRSPGQFSWTTTFGSLTAYAYHLDPWQISWIESGDAERAFYSVAATTPPTATEDQTRRNLQALLADRFRMLSHFETKETSGYELTIAKNGPKLAVAHPAGEPPPLPWWFGGKSPDAFEGRTITSMEGLGALAITGRDVPISDLIEHLSETLGVPIHDGTHLTGRYYFGLRFANPADLRPGPDVPPATPAVIEDKLGLRLENRKLNSDFLIVTKFERQPTQN